MKKYDSRKILDVKINCATSKEVLENIKGFLLSDKQHHIITLNPEMVVEAQYNSYFKKIINESDLSIADGTGIIFADMFVNRRILPERIQGIDLINKICQSDFAKDNRIYLLGAGEGIAEKAKLVLIKKYPDLQIVGAEEGMAFEMSNFKYQMTNEYPISLPDGQAGNIQYPISHNKIKYDELNTKLIERINNAKPNIIFVAFGAPKQEKWIFENIKRIPSVKLAIGVGGSFDFISGKMKRAPRIMQKIGLEWLWRLILEPCRIKRICDATVKFGWLIFKKS